MISVFRSKLVSGIVTHVEAELFVISVESYTIIGPRMCLLDIINIDQMS